MTASQRRTVTVVVAALGAAFLLVWAANAGPGHVILERTVGSVTDQVEPATPSQVDDERADAAESSEDRSPTGGGDWVRDVTAFVLLVAGLLLTALIVRQVFIRIQQRLVEERLVVPLEPLPDLETARAALERDEQRQRDALAGADVRNGIVACWVVFEEAAAEAAVARQPAETASEFVVRFLHLLDVDPRAVGVLAGLFLEARFSSHPLPAGARARAEQALHAIHRDLAHTGATP
ncbi:MAG: DUF4129 domain-containing protein [Marmoricola sp.]